MKSIDFTFRLSLMCELLIMLNLGLQNAGRPLMEKIHEFHDWIMILVVRIVAMIILAIRRQRIYRSRGFVDNQAVEFMWTVTPCIVLTFIILPSLRLLYIYDDNTNRVHIIKAIGNQWYWRYDYPRGLDYNSYINSRDYRLLNSDHRLSIIVNQPTSLLITAADVLHSWALPVMALKADAVPGRVNKLTFTRARPGLFFGQCREICGRNHSFIPIAIERIVFNCSYYFENNAQKS